jgi:hypothetical protein
LDAPTHRLRNRLQWVLWVVAHSASLNPPFYESYRVVKGIPFPFGHFAVFDPSLLSERPVVTP